MSFFKHVGTVNTKKVIIVQRQLNGDDEHMAVVIYSGIMPAKYHDDVMKLLESPEGQAAFEFRDILERRMMADGQNMLQALSHENYLKRVPAANVMVTPNSKSSMRLDELTKLLNKVGRGDEAVKQLDRMENAQGYADPAKAALTDSQVAESVSLADMGIDVAAENAKLSAPAAPAPVDQTALMMQMMQTMQAMQQQISEMRGDATPAPKAKAAAPKAKAASKTKTAARA